MVHLSNLANTKPILLLLGHQARTGKDSFAAYLAKHHGFVQFSFAAKLKQICAEMFDFSEDQLYGTLKEIGDERYPNLRELTTEPITAREHDIKLSPRRILQFVGQDFRSLYADVWADYTFRQIGESGNSRFAISDLRFPSEYYRALNFGWNRYFGLNTPDVYAVKIERTNRPAISGAGDPSETSLLNFSRWHTTITNDSTFEDLYKQADSLVEDLEKRSTKSRDETTAQSHTRTGEAHVTILAG